jgi:hypothetical protein
MMQGGKARVSGRSGKPIERRKTVVPHEARNNREEFARRGRELYERNVLPVLRPDDKDKFVAVDVESGDYEMDRDDYAATERLLSRRPDAQIWLEQVGQRAAYRLGARSASGAEE